MIIFQFLLGWPAIICFVLIATAAAWRPSKNLMIVALVWSVPGSLYLLGGNGWIQIDALYIPLSLGLSVFLIHRNQIMAPKLLLVPMYAIYVLLGLAG